MTTLPRKKVQQHGGMAASSSSNGSNGSNGSNDSSSSSSVSPLVLVAFLFPAFGGFNFGFDIGSTGGAIQQLRAAVGDRAFDDADRAFVIASRL